MIINFDRESREFINWVDGKTKMQFVTIQGKAQTGKTTLIKKLKNICDSRRIESAKINLKRHFDPHAILDFIVTQLGHINFSSYENHSTDFAKDINIGVSRNLAFFTKIEVNANGSNEETKHRRLVLEFFKDFDIIQNFKPAIVFFDHYESANDKLKEWLLNTFYPRSSLSQRIITITAGQEVPPKDSDWEDNYKHFLLDGIEESYWNTYVQQKNFKTTPETLSALCKEHKNNPGRIAMALEEHNNRIGRAL